jgi:hypothetical protein
MLLSNIRKGVEASNLLSAMHKTQIYFKLQEYRLDIKSY